MPNEDKQESETPAVEPVPEAAAPAAPDPVVEEAAAIATDRALDQVDDHVDAFENIWRPLLPEEEQLVRDTKALAQVLHNHLTFLDARTTNPQHFLTEAKQKLKECLAYAFHGITNRQGLRTS